MRFDKSKHKILYLGRGNPHYQYKLRDEKIECSLATQPDTQILGCIQSSAARKASEGILPLWSVLVRPHPEYGVQR